MGAGRPGARRLPGARARRVHQGLRQPVHAAGHRRPAGRAAWRIATSSSKASANTRVAASAAPARNRWPTVRWNSSTVCSPTMSQDRRAEPRDDVLTGLATATYPDGSTPEVEDVARVASNVFSAGQETTVRLLGASLQTLGERPDIQAQLRKDRSLMPNFIEESLRHREPGQGRLPVEPEAGQRRRGRPARRHHRDGGAGRRQPRSAPVRRPQPRSIRPARMPASTSRSAAASTAAPARRWRAPKRGWLSSGCWTARRTSGSTSSIHGPANDRRYQYVPTYILRGLTELHLEFTPA